MADNHEHLRADGSRSSADDGGTVALIGLGSCYALGTFTDNFYKQAAILIAASTQMTGMQSIATVLFSLPFILFSAWAGAVADRVPKKTVAVVLKAMELTALLLGGIMLITENWIGMLAVMFCMGTQSTFFSPAINGSIPENFPPARVPRANALIKLASTAAILAGMAAAGFVLDLRDPGGVLAALDLRNVEYGRLVAALVVAVVALLGLLTALVLKHRPASVPEGGYPEFPWTGPVQSLKQAWKLREDKPLMLVMLADAWFFGIAAIAVISIANLCSALDYSKTAAGLMTALLMVGVAVGSLIAGRFSATSWRFLLFPSACGMAGMLVLVGLTPFLPAGGQQFWLGGTLLATGVFGGIYLIPLESFIQVRPAAGSKGRVIAVSNFMSFMAMALFGAAFKVIGLLPPAATFIFYGTATFCFIGFFAAKRLAAVAPLNLQDSATSILGLCMQMLLSLRYAVTEKGLDSLAPQSVEPGSPKAGPGMLILPNHPALIDPVILYSRLSGLVPRPLADERQMSGVVQRAVGRIVKAVTIPDPVKSGRKDMARIREGLDAVTEALRRGENILLYPSGQVYRVGREVVGSKAAAAHILAEVPEARVLLVRTTGLWGSSFSYAAGTVPQMMSQLGRGLLTVLANLIFFVPKRRVSLVYEENKELAALARTGDKRAFNRFLEAFYNADPEPARFVRRFFWQGREAEEALPPVISASEASELPHAHADIPDELRREVYALLREHAGLPEEAPLAPEQELARDLFLDSLGVMEIALALEDHFGHSVTTPELLLSVDDCLMAAAGRLDQASLPAASPPESWFGNADAPDAHEQLEIVADAANIPEAFLRLARKDPSRPLTADRSGIRTRRQMLTGVLALARRFSGLPGERLGIMLPATPAALGIWLAAMLAGKEPVFINWTVGRRNLEHCLSLANLSHVITATPLLDQLERTGNILEGLPVEFLAADALAAELSLYEKLRAAALAFLHCSPFPFFLETGQVRDFAAVLFTSGSESMPKGVPLTHANIMCNGGDVLRVLQVRKRDRLLAMLPPFHSFGLLAGLALPAASGLAAAYHPNPTESGALLSLVRDFKLSLLGATPAFLDGMLARAKGGEDLASLRYAFVGAEKCPDRVYRTFAQICPEAALCEGYGITECSPVVAVNRPGEAVPGTIGRVLPSVEAVLVIETEGESGSIDRRRAEPGQTGMLLVRGPSIFSGYLTFEATDSSPAPNIPDPFVSFEGKSWYRTGDLLSMDPDGRLTFRGRLKRFVKMGGEMISLPQMEDVLQQVFAGRPGGPEDGSPFIAVEARPGSEDSGQAELLAFTTLDLSAREVNTALRSAGLAPIYAVRRVIRLESIPVLGTGKTDYRALVALAG